MRSFTDRALQIIKSIPAGKVMTYGQVAALAGSPRGARQVVRILHSMSRQHQLPWHRVMNSKGEIGLKDEERKTIQKLRLESEGILFLSDFSISLTQYQYDPQEFLE